MNYGTNGITTPQVEVWKRIKWNGWNRRPNVAITADKKDWQNPSHNSRFSSEGTEDPDGDALTYGWDFGLGSGQAYFKSGGHFQLSRCF